ncbi:hypothetical protein F383_00752 [Gossypium arboreum]|uniref:Uncharacterized protein n=1 Tax=Gossypium arboreum TaxID=29729 RepID=A0A0B0PH83_GOSAR|nr:hypothetical protein F383_00752 [Gossypium arboreum]
MRKMSMSCVMSWYRFIQLARVGDLQRFYHTIKLSCWVNERKPLSLWHVQGLSHFVYVSL